MFSLCVTRRHNSYLPCNCACVLFFVPLRHPPAARLKGLLHGSLSCQAEGRGAAVSDVRPAGEGAAAGIESDLHRGGQR